jgi:hypothetical protein
MRFSNNLFWFLVQYSRPRTDEKNILRRNPEKTGGTSSVHEPQHVHCVAMFAVIICSRGLLIMLS